MGLTDEAVADSGPKTPVRDALREALPFIAQARVDGASWAAIFRKLKKDGKNVGAGTSSFNAARRALHDELNALTALICQSNLGAAITEFAASPETPPVNQPATRLHNRASFADDRKPLAFGEH